MTVHFIGAGPGAADLITLRAARIIAAARTAAAACPFSLSGAPKNAIIPSPRNLSTVPPCASTARQRIAKW